MSELEKATYDRGFYNGIREVRQVFAKHLNVSTSTDEIKWDNVSKTDILSEIDDFMMKSESYSQPQLTIPQSIAEQADKTDLDSLFKWGNKSFTNGLIMNRMNICLLYMPTSQAKPSELI